VSSCGERPELKRARRCHIADKAAAIQAALRAPQLAQPPELCAAYGSAVVALTKVIGAFSEQIAVLEQQVSASFREHPSAGIYLSQPGLGPLLAARLPGEFGDDPDRYASAKGRRNYAPASPITRASGKSQDHPRSCASGRAEDRLLGRGRRPPAPLRGGSACL
jgi:transposase